MFTYLLLWWSNFATSWIATFSSSCDGQISCPVESLLFQVPVMVWPRVQLIVKLRVQMKHCFLKCLWWSNFVPSWWSNFVSSWITAFSSACDGQTTCPIDGQTSCPVESLLSKVSAVVKLRAQSEHTFLCAGSSYVRWGHTSCPGSSELVYAGQCDISLK